MFVVPVLIRECQRCANTDTQVRRPDGGVEVLRVERPVRNVASPVVAQLNKGGPGGDTVGVIRLTSFNARAQRDLASAITQLQAQGAKV
jgi:C-terminal processing protease CtpA/Prc